VINLAAEAIAGKQSQRCEVWMMQISKSALESTRSIKPDETSVGTHAKGLFIKNEYLAG